MLTRNFYNIGFTPAYVYMYSTSATRCSFIPLSDADKKNARTILNTDGNAFTRPWFGQLMTGPQLMAYLCQVNMWLEFYKPRIEI